MGSCRSEALRGADVQTFPNLTGHAELNMKQADWFIQLLLGGRE